MKRILGLDLGTASIGWAVVLKDENGIHIEGLGSRIIDFENSEASNFGSGKSVSKCADRTKKRTTRKCYDRYIIRRTLLTDFFRTHKMLPDEELIKLEKISLWGLRARAVTEKISLPELARVLYHINQKRGYKSVKGDTEDTSAREYVAQIKSRNKTLVELGLTVGQYLYNNLLEDGRYRCKNQIFPREAYKREYDAIMNCQKQFYPEVLTDTNISKLRDNIIFYQRDLKSCKHLVSICELEKKDYTKVNSKGENIVVTSGPKVAHSSNPLAQICRIWETINNIKLTNKNNELLIIDLRDKIELFKHLSTNGSINKKQLCQILSINDKEYFIDKDFVKSFKGNSTLISIRDAANKNKVINEIIDEFEAKLFVEFVDKETGEISKIVNPKFEKLRFYRLWHTLYSISDKSTLKDVLVRNFNITDETVLEKLCEINFRGQAYAKKSVRAINKILPYLVKGFNLYDAKVLAGYKDTTLTTEENMSRVLLQELPRLKNNELRQPIVEKIINQMINLVNALMVQYNCHFDEIRVELARELKQSKKEREKTTKSINDNEKVNKKAKDRILEHHLYPSLSRIEKIKLYDEANSRCFYCGQPITLVDFLNGQQYEVEHIIPKSILFNNSFANKVCSCQKCNRDKNNQTAYDFMASKGNKVLEDYINKVNEYYSDKKISKAKRDNLLASSDNLSNDFIERQLRQTQYISKKACQILQSVCYNVTTSTGAITDYLRRIWGWKNILEDINIDRYRLCDMTSFKEIEHKGSIIKREIITDWSKRMDHRHHAIDALVVACTSQGFIQRLNNISKMDDVPFQSIEHQSKEQQERYNKLDKYAIYQPHFTYNEVKNAVDNIIVSFKSTRKATTPGKRYIYKNGKKVIAQSNILIPRGALSEESVYGKININGKDSIVIKYKLGVGQGMLFSDNKLTKEKIEKVLENIVDRRIRDVVLNHIIQHNYNLSECFKDTICFNSKDGSRPIYSVRCLTGLEKVNPVRIERDGSIHGYVKSDSTHNISIYKDIDGNYYENECTFRDAVERKKLKIPAIITDTNAMWDKIFNLTNIDENFVSRLPKINSQFVVSLQRDDMFVLGMETSDFEYALEHHDYSQIGQHLYKVQNCSKGNYRFCLHSVTKFDLKKANKSDGRFVNIQSLTAFFSKNPIKIRVDLLGNIIVDK